MTETNSKLLEKHRDILSFRDLAVSTIATYISYLTAFILWVEANLPGRLLTDVSWEDLRAYVRFLKGPRNLNPRTVNVHIAQLHDFWHYVLHRDWDKYEVPFLHYDEKLPNVPSKEQVNTLIDSIANLKHRAEISLLYSSGMRVSELCRLKCGDIIRSRGAIRVSKSKNRSERYAVLSEKAYRHLVNYVRLYYQGASKEGWLFPGQKAGEHICAQSVANVFRHNLEACGMGMNGFTLHSLRHAFGLHLYEAGTDLMSIKEAMGHKSLSSTTVYLTLGIGNGRSVKSPYDFD